MTALYFVGAVLFLAMGHLCKALRWRYFIRMYEDTPLSVLVSSLAGGYLINFFVPFHLGDLFRVWMAGRQMENRYGYAAATILVDRFLDVLAVGVILGVMALLTPAAVLRRAAIGYLILIVILALLLAVAVVFHRGCKRLALTVCSVFNERIKFWLLFFLWSLISSFKDACQKLNKGWLLLQTAAMWGCYLASYYLIAAMLGTLQNPCRLTDIFLMMFHSAPLGQSTFAMTNGVFSATGELLLCVYILLPLPVMIGLSLLASRRRRQSRPPHTKRILPQLKPEEQLRFLRLYFESDDRQSIRAYLEMNHDVGILRDYSSGSDAATMLCIRQNETVFRKYAFGDAAQKLEQQAMWLKRNAGRLPMTTVCGEKHSAFAYCYDMPYDSTGIGMFQYIYSHTTAESWEILRAVLEDLRGKLYGTPDKVADSAMIAKYVSSKVTANLEAIRKNRTLRGLMEPEYLTINGVRYRNLPLLMPMLEPAHLQAVFEGDTLAEVHGDLTVENIICYAGGAHESAYYLIDPNPSNPISTPNLDYAKLLQSLHGKYELLSLSPSLEIRPGSIEFFLPDAGQYRRLYELLHEWMTENLDAREVRSVYYHEVIHWLRLLPYRIRRNERTAPQYYAALILVMNDVRRLFEEE